MPKRTDTVAFMDRERRGAELRFSGRPGRGKAFPVRYMNNYFERGERFYRIAPAEPAADAKRVFLIHGWGVRAVSMEPLGRALAAHGCIAYNYDYPTSKKRIAAHAAVFLERWRALLTAERIGGPVFFVTHSMGGLVLRVAMAAMTAAECRWIAGVVMLGPPNQGSGWAHFGRGPIRWVNASLSDMLPGEASFLQTIPPPPVLPPVLIVAGDHDEKVALRRTPLPEGQPYGRKIVSSTHFGLRDPRRVLPEILAFLADVGG